MVHEANIILRFNLSIPSSQVRWCHPLHRRTASSSNEAEETAEEFAERVADFMANKLGGCFSDHFFHHLSLKIVIGVENNWQRSSLLCFVTYNCSPESSWSQCS